MIHAVDSHCHLDYDELAGDIPGVLSRAQSAGISLMLTISTRVRDFPRTLALAEAHPEIFCSVGTHPHSAAEETHVSAQDLVLLSRHPKVAAIGEAGLDYHYEHSPREAQKKSFLVHIEAARNAGLPLIIHSREAEEDTAGVIEQEMAKGTFKPLLHCYSSKPILAERGLAVGAYISFSGILTFKKAEEIRAVARSAPLDRILVETDAPFLAPVPHRGKVNEPAMVMHTLKALADLRDMPVEEMAAITNRNFFRLFDKVPVPPAYAASAA